MALGATIATLTAVLSIGYNAQHPARNRNHSYNDTNGFRRAAVALCFIRRRQTQPRPTANDEHVECDAAHRDGAPGKPLCFIFHA
jgi:hypothetical protein